MCNTTSKPQIIVDVYTFAKGMDLAFLSSAKTHGCYTSLEVMRNHFFSEFYYRYRNVVDFEKYCDIYQTAYIADGIPCMDVHNIPVSALIEGRCPAPAMQMRFSADFDATDFINEYFTNGVFGYTLKNSRIIVRFVKNSLAF